MASPTKGPTIAVVCGIVGVLGAVWAYWLSLPGIVFGGAAVILGVRAVRGGSRDVGAVAVTLGLVALFLVPSVLFVANDAEVYGRHCVLNPADPGC